MVESKVEAVELIGLPGSGKSTLASYMAQNGWASRDVSLLPFPRGLKGRFSAFLAAPIFSSVCYLCALTCRGGRGLTGAFLPQKRYLLSGNLDLSANTVIDEGPIHALFILLFGAHLTRASRFFLGLALRISCRRYTGVIFLDVPKEVCRDRFNQRSQVNSRFRAGGTHDHREQFMRDETYVEIVKIVRHIMGSKFSTCNGPEYTIQPDPAKVR